MILRVNLDLKMNMMNPKRKPRLPENNLMVSGFGMHP
jgi:hypothetical protein